MSQKKTIKDEERSQAPDGGWGWFVCLGSSLITLSLRSLEPSFGLIFHDLLTDLKIDSTKMSTFPSVFDACANFSGIFVGPLLNKFSFRKVAAVGAVLCCTGLTLTSFANSFTHILITYSILNGIGNGLAIASSFIALNIYFDKKRGQAVSYSSAGTAIAMMIVPQAGHFLLGLYGFRGTMMIIGAWTMHSIVGACLLRPLETKTCKKISIVKIETNKKICDETELPLMEKTEAEKNLNESLNKLDNKQDQKCLTFLKTFTDIFNLDLLNNYSYLNVIFGLSLFAVSEVNFKLVTPFFLRDTIGMSEAEVAFCLSLTAFTDILSRLLLPIIYDKFGFKKRRLFWVNVLCLAIGRSIFAERTKGIWLYAILVINGFIRGAVIQNLNLSVSETCSLKILPHAYGFYMVSKGIFSLVFSPIVGYIRDYSGSYRICLHSMNSLIVVCFINWGIEFAWEAIKSRRTNQEKNE
ncbi:monocarboxylate transporter 12, partial [Microplitis demolitor]|uniref:monocarboxylate transporter 12 n=1 Tax=Microplitis demolitor TaxID=69319 RepID=UPI0004CD98D3